MISEMDGFEIACKAKKAASALDRIARRSGDGLYKLHKSAVIEDLEIVKIYIKKIESFRGVKNGR